MTTTTEHETANSAFRRPIGGSTISIVPTVLSLWAASVIFLGAKGVFVAAPGEPPYTIIAGVAAPPAVFLLAYSASIVASVFDRKS